MRTHFLKKLSVMKSIFFAFCLCSFSGNSYAYTEGLITAEADMLPKSDLDNGDFKPIYGGSIKADVMNNLGIDFGLGATWANGYQFIDGRIMYWFSGHMTDFYLGISSHAQYFPQFGIGGGLVLGESLQLTEYVNFDVNAEAGYGSNKFFSSGNGAFYVMISSGLSFSFM